MPPPGFEPGEWDPQSHVLSRLHHRGKQMKNSAVLKNYKQLNICEFIYINIRYDCISFLSALSTVFKDRRGQYIK